MEIDNLLERTAKTEVEIDHLKRVEIKDLKTEQQKIREKLHSLSDISHGHHHTIVFMENDVKELKGNIEKKFDSMDKKLDKIFDGMAGFSRLKYLVYGGFIAGKATIALFGGKLMGWW